MPTAEPALASAVRYLGVDLAWRDSDPARPANETGVVALDPSGTVLDAGWTRGVEVTAHWMQAWSLPHTVAFVDAPLVVANDAGQRVCETELGRCYGAWKVSANSTNRSTPAQAGVRLRRVLEGRGWHYDDGCRGPPAGGRSLSECYPYTTLVGSPELGYDRERPRYKRPPRGQAPRRFAAARAAACDDLVARLAGLAAVRPPLDLSSHVACRALVDRPSPLAPRAYKHREDLIDAALCAWTAAVWAEWGPARCQVLGAADGTLDEGGRGATIIAPARPDQRRPPRRRPSPTAARPG
ncbi:MAG TPA: DUF429 domain-containing protein [Acidimicrobiales bacterium]|nr:DUF429 domain-containing protein [Acidimicrobiales bacterium]